MSLASILPATLRNQAFVPVHCLRAVSLRRYIPTYMYAAAGSGTSPCSTAISSSLGVMGGKWPHAKSSDKALKTTVCDN